MSTTLDLVGTIKKELKAAQMTYADLALVLGMAESSVKRMSLSRMPFVPRAALLRTGWTLSEPRSCASVRVSSSHTSAVYLRRSPRNTGSA
jgi:hypothetical protein